MSLAFEVVLVEPTNDAAALWEPGADLLAAAGLLEPVYEVGGSTKPRAAGEVPAVLRRIRTRPPLFDVDGVATSCAYGFGLGAAYYDIVVNDDARVPRRELLEECLLRFSRTVRVCYARVYDPVWEKWQNERFVDQLKLLGRSSKGLKLKWDPDFEEEVVDTSGNPGRIASSHGTMEALGHEMWIGPEFWKLTGTRRQAVAAAFETHVVDGFLSVTLAPRPFRDGNPPSEQFRRTLFP